MIYTNYIDTSIASILISTIRYYQYIPNRKKLFIASVYTSAEAASRACRDARIILRATKTNQLI